MKNNTIVVLGGVAIVLAAVAFFLGREDARPSVATGAKIAPAFDVAKVAKIDIGDSVSLVSGEEGWIIPSLQDYPADISKIRDALSKLGEAKVGQVVRGRTLKERTRVSLKDAAGKELSSVILGDRHEKWGRGRYAEYKGSSVLIADTLDDFGSDPKRWCETKIVDTPYIYFREIAQTNLDESVLGFATGVVAKVTINGDTNRTVTVGNVVKGGGNRYLKIDGMKWLFEVPSYSVEELLPKPPPEEKTEPQADDIKAEPEAKVEPAATPAAAPAIVSKPVEVTAEGEVKEVQ